MFLISIYKNDGISQQELSRRFSINKAMAARSVKKLYDLGYITRKSSKLDRREYGLYITERGRLMIAPIIEVFNK
jgi:DNA-binding MarR family transcriptional regulator